MIGIKGLDVRLGGFSLRSIDLEVKDGEYFVLLGPTGAGKTVILEALAGLCPARSGVITIDDREVQRLPPEGRQIGYVPQDFALFPFLNTRENIRFGMKRERGRDSTNARIDELAQMLSITQLLDRSVGTLSGGEKQRVSLARALATQPKVLLLDEPLSSLDLSTAKYLRLELKRFHERFGITTIHVTHSLMEAEELADRIAVIHDGRVEQVGTRDEVLLYPRNDIVAEFVGRPNILECKSITDIGHGLVEALCGDLRIILPNEGTAIRKVVIFPRDIYVAAEEPPGPGLNRFLGKVTAIHRVSTLARIGLEIGETRLLAEVQEAKLDEMGIALGDPVHVLFKMRGIRLV